MPETCRVSKKVYLYHTNTSTMNNPQFIFTVLLLFALIQHTLSQEFYLGADLSSLNQMEDCEAVFYENGEAKDPYQIFVDHHANLVRYRLWHTPAWGDYSDLADVKAAIERAKTTGLSVLLDLHNSDTWADPGNQLRPEAWQDVEDLNVLGDSLYNYTYQTLAKLHQENLLPEMVQIGNETNTNILRNEGDPGYPLDWDRNILLFNRAIDAVHQINVDFGKDVKTMIHIAQPENALWWFADAATNGFTTYDMIGVSYYPGWSEMGIREVGGAIKTLKETYNKEVMIVEVAYPWTLEWNDNAGNILGEDNLLNYYNNNPSTGTQKDFLTELSWLVKENGGSGVIYWEPAWVSTECGTQWAEQGSHLENSVFFDFDWQLHEGIEFMEYDYSVMPTSLDSVAVNFKVDMTGVDTSEGVFVTGDFTGEAWQFMPMVDVGDNIFVYQGKIPGRSYGAYIFQNKADWNASSRENVPAECALFWDTHRAFTVGDEPVEFAYVWSTCVKIDEVRLNEIVEQGFKLSPNPIRSTLHIQSGSGIKQIEIFNISGVKVYELTGAQNSIETIDMSSFPDGVYFLVLTNKEGEEIPGKLVKAEN